MSAPLVVSIPHRLGREEATRRLRRARDGGEHEFDGEFTLGEDVGRRPNGGHTAASEQLVDAVLARNRLA